MEKNKFSELLQSFGINEDLLNSIAFETGLIERQRLLSALDILYSFCMTSTSGEVSYNTLAVQIESGGGASVSKQSVHKKVAEQCILFFEKVLERIILQRLESNNIATYANKCKFKRILLQDSTVIKLPIRLYELFSGVSNGHSKVCNARIQGTYDLVSGQFVSFSIDPYSKNDLISAPELSLQKGDLVLRDRGYLTRDEFERHLNNEADCIFRHKFAMVVLDPKTEKPLDILKMLEKHNSLDIQVMLNNKEKTIVRLTASLVNQKVADSRRRKAKKEKKQTPSKEYLKLLSWSIYLTTIPKEKADHNQVFRLYSFRWRIETIFKSWKSYLNFDHIHNVSQMQLNVLLLARFIMIVIYIQFIFPSCQRIIAKLSTKRLSLLKMVKYLSSQPQKLVPIIEEINQFNGKVKENIAALIRYCTYDSRKRKNFEQQIEVILYLS